MLNDDRRTTEETYAIATGSSNLRCETREDAPRADTDLLIAAGWSPSRIGRALLRLHTEYDRAEKPRVMTAKDFERQAEQQCPSGCLKSIKAKAQEIADAHNRQQAMLLWGKLKTLRQAREQLAIQLMKWKADPAQAEPMSMAVLVWWLHKTCRVCEGRKFEVQGGTGRLSNRVCKACGGTGEARAPHGEIGKRLANFMDVCLQCARQSIGNRLGRGRI